MSAGGAAAGGGADDGDRPYAVLDIDGVLADVRHRVHHVAGGRRDWPAFFAAAADDPPLPDGLALAKQLSRTHVVAYLSGRPEWLREVTESWLDAYGLPAGAVLLRPHRDYRPARVLKLGVLRRLARERPVGLVVDDDEQVVATLRDGGFPVRHATWMHDPQAAATLVEAQERLGRT